MLHLNMNGELLVNYEPVGHLPPNIRSHETYKRFFGDLDLEVKPSSMGLNAYVFTVDSLPHNTSFTLFLCGTDLVVLEQTSQHTVRQLIPHTEFAHKFPASFDNEYSYWLLKSTSPAVMNKKQKSKNKPVKEGRTAEQFVVELCAGTYVEYVASGGRASYVLDLVEMTLQEKPPLAGRWLIDIASPTYCEIAAKITDRLDVRSFVHMFVDKHGCIAIHLTRLNLNFTVDTQTSKGKRSNGNTFSLHVLSNEYLNMRVSDAQQLDTLIGLRKCVLLCDVDWLDEEHSTRLLLVPNGTLEIGTEQMITAGRKHIEKYVDVKYESSRSRNNFYSTSVLCTMTAISLFLFVQIASHFRL